MQAEIISIGDELLIGQTVNTNSSWLGENLNKIGIRIHRSTTISDNRGEIIHALNEASSRSQVIVMTGGLGPTKDDITKHTLCEYFNSKLVLNEEALERITGFFRERGIPLLEENRSQADLPESCTVIQNFRGTACGMWFEKNGVVFVSMPGVPYEMYSMMEDQVFPKLLAHFDRPNIRHRTILTIGAGESSIAKQLESWENSLEEHSIKLAYLPSPGMVKLRMSMYAGEPAMQKKIMDEKEAELMSIIGTLVYGYEKESLQSVVGDLLRGRNETLAVAESLTGGFLAHLITSIPGASDYFVGSITSYINRMKEDELQVAASVIAEKNVVSREVAEAMAVGIRKKFGTNWGLSTTGVAGPSGGSDEIPVGTVWMAVASEKGVHAFMFRYGKNRLQNIEMAANSALNALRKEILRLSGAE